MSLYCFISSLFSRIVRTVCPVGKQLVASSGRSFGVQAPAQRSVTSAFIELPSTSRTPRIFGFAPATSFETMRDSASPWTNLTPSWRARSMMLRMQSRVAAQPARRDEVRNGEEKRRQGSTNLRRG